MSDAGPIPPPASVPPPPYTPPEDKTLATVVYVLYLVGLLNGLTALIGFVIALGSRAAAPPLLETHYRFQIRTMVGCLVLGAAGLVIFIVGIPLMLVLIGFLFLKLAFLTWGLSALYLAVRSVVGLIRLSNGEPYPNPDSWTL
ncbi:MAG TPA: hypothetical protein VF459_15205 [Caulobacteraceae bacterium]